MPVERIRSSPGKTEQGWYEIRGPDEDKSLQNADGLSKIELSFVYKNAPKGLRTTEGYVLLFNDSEQPQKWENCFMVIDPYAQYLRCFETHNETAGHGPEIAALNLRSCRLTEDKPRRRPLNSSQNCFMVANQWELLYLCTGTAEDKALCIRGISAASNNKTAAESNDVALLRPVPISGAALPAHKTWAASPTLPLAPALVSPEQRGRRSPADVHELESRYEAARRALADYLAKIRALEDRVRQLEEEARASTEAAARSQADNANVIEYLKDKTRGLAESLAQATRRAEELEEAGRAQADMRVAMLQAQLDAAGRALAEQRQRERELLRAQEEQSSALAQKQGLQNEALAGRQAAAELLTRTEELEAAQRCVEAQQLAMERLEARRAAELRELGTARAEVMELRAEIAEVRRERDRLVETQARQVEELAALRSAVGRARGEAEAAAQAARLAEAARGAARAEALEEDLRQARAALAETERRAQESTKQVADLEKAFARARAEAHAEARARSVPEWSSPETVASEREGSNNTADRRAREQSAGSSTGAVWMGTSDLQRPPALGSLPPGQSSQSPQRDRAPALAVAAEEAQEGVRLLKARALIADISASLSRRASPLTAPRALSPFGSASQARLSVVAGRPGLNGVATTDDRGQPLRLQQDRSPISFDDFLRG